MPLTAIRSFVLEAYIATPVIKYIISCCKVIAVLSWEKLFFVLKCNFLNNRRTSVYFVTAELLS